MRTAQDAGFDWAPEIAVLAGHTEEA
jgi:hypothetical protein